MFFTPEQLLVFTAQDLQNRIITNTEYDLIRGLGLCRQLLTGGNPLAIAANRNLKLPRIEFEISNNEDFQKGRLRFGTISWNTIVPNEIIKGTRIVNLDDFLATFLFYYRKYAYSVKDIISFGANVLGGVHAGDPSEEGELYLLELYKMRADDANILLFAAKAICQVTLKGLEPIMKAISRHTPVGGY